MQISEDSHLTKDPRIVISTKKLNKSYGDQVAVKELSLDIFKGEIFGFLGPNGAGKTTTISMLCGLLKKDSGEILINGYRTNGQYARVKHLLGLCPQDIVIWESLTCLEQLEITGRLYNMDRQRAISRALELLEVLGLSEKRNRLGKTLSGGMKRRLNIALALIHEPEILILDEPQAGLDPQSRILVREYIQQLAKEITIILTTHDMDEADRMADRVAIIDHGQLLILDTPENLKNQIGKGDILEVKTMRDQQEILHRLLPTLTKNFNGLTLQENRLRLVAVDVIDKLPNIIGSLKKNKLIIEDIAVRKKTLEDVFISLTGRGLRE
jgi:ABC-2 type transport system ATP-binding protein